MRYYYKLVSKQDVTRSFVVNKHAVSHFFNVPLSQHGDEAIVYLKRSLTSEFEPVVLVLHQDCRLLIKNKDFEIGDIVYFEKIESRRFFFKVIKSSNEISLIKQRLQKSNYYLSDKNII